MKHAMVTSTFLGTSITHCGHIGSWMLCHEKNLCTIFYSNNQNFSPHQQTTIITSSHDRSAKFKCIIVHVMRGVSA